MTAHVSKPGQSCKGACTTSPETLPERQAGVMLDRMWEWTVTRLEDNLTLLEALVLRLPWAPQGFLHQIIRKGRVRRGTQILTAGDRLATGERLQATTTSRLDELAAAGGILPQSILFEDHYVMVLCKASNLATHPGSGHEDSLLTRLRTYMTWRRAPHSVSPVHRLDAGTSGVVLFAKGRQAAGHYGKLMMAGEMEKSYLALVGGTPGLSGELNSPVTEGNVRRPALTRYRRIGQGDGVSLLRLELVTGRRHQARQHLAEAGWPIVGDQRYGGRSWRGLDHPFLHCERLSFPDFHDDRNHQVVCDLPQDMIEILNNAGLSRGTWDRMG